MKRITFTKTNILLATLDSILFNLNVSNFILNSLIFFLEQSSHGRKGNKRKETKLEKVLSNLFIILLYPYQPFECDICGKKYTQRSGLKSHQKSHYPDPDMMNGSQTQSQSQLHSLHNLIN